MEASAATAAALLIPSRTAFVARLTNLAEVHVKGDHLSLVSGELCKMGRLSAIPGTEIQDPFACCRGKEDGGHLRGFVLNLKKALLKSLVLIDPPSKIGQMDSLGRMRGWLSHNAALFFKAPDEILPIGLERVGSDGERRDAVLCFEKGFCEIDPPLPHPLPHQPFRIGIKHGQIFHRGFVAIRKSDLIPVATDFSQNRVDKGDDVGRLPFFCLLHRLIDGRRLGDAIKEKNLIKRQAKKI